MDRSRFRLGAAIAAAVAVFACAAGSAAADTHWANLRVVTHTGRTLAEFRQYTGSTTVRSAKTNNDCFGSRSSGKRYRLEGSNALGIVKDALASDSDLRPLILSDAFVDDGFGLGVCAIGGFETIGFSYWDLIRNDLAATTGAEFVPVRNGDNVLWYFTSGSEPSSGPRELRLRAPASAEPGDAFTVKVVRFTAKGKSSPAGGVGVFAGSRRLGTTKANGELRVRLGTSAKLQATGTASDIPSNHVAVCVSGTAGQCPNAHGARIYGSAHADRIHGTRGWDRIAARGGGDVVDLRSGGQDRVNCGGGRDKVILDRGDRNDRIASSCERVSRR
jgi:hypothetical protein